MKKQIISLAISVLMVIFVVVPTAFGTTSNWWSEEKDEIIRIAEVEMENYRVEMNITVSDKFQENLRITKALLSATSNYSWLGVQEVLANYLNVNLVVAGENIIYDLVSYSQDYNSSRSNKARSISSGGDLDDTDDIQTITQYDAVRLDKPTALLFVNNNELMDNDGIIESAERIEIRLPVDSANITLLENFKFDEMKFDLGEVNVDIVLAMIFTNSIQEQFKSSGILSSCELNDKGLAFYFKSMNSASQYYLMDAFFIPLGTNDTTDCDDKGSNPKPGETSPNTPDENKIILQIGNEKVIVGNNQRTIEVPPFIENSRTMVPLRFIGEELGAEIVWNDEERKVEYKLKDIVLELWIGQSIARINGEEVMLDEDPLIKPFIINSRTVVPLRFISESLGFKITWNDSTQEITIEQ